MHVDILNAKTDKKERPTVVSFADLTDAKRT